ncbi:hypothetical protein GCM10017643_45890 [Ancylobacter dichloromethanicus]|uniref:DNA-directed DNA polymerase n=1 Tax=Ancylobacter dichloromethanicus TaxID=518825 RepID=A0A9W6N1R5_9HYPH|nr:hypothetical protein GCM10017643_45890 [Ancylobacter dichloromethanicus]
MPPTQGVPGSYRKIIHVDMDAFYASVEQRDYPELRGKPVAVGGSAARGVVAAASYEARAFGVRSALPSVTAKRKCPELIFVTPRFDVYRAVSAQIREIFAEHTDLIEPLSLDEAYLDVTSNHQGIPVATPIAELIRAKIKAVTGLSASAGIYYNKFLAKMASDQNKPNGQFVITPHQGPAFVEALPVKKFRGVGPATAARMQRLGIERGPTSRQSRSPSSSSISGKPAPGIIGSRGRSTRGPSSPTARASRSAPRTPSPPISSSSTPRGRSLYHSLPRSGAIARRTGSAAGP